VTKLISTLQTDRVYPKNTTVGRWSDLESQLGHFNGCKRNGYRYPSRLCGSDLILLALYRSVYPKCTLAKLNAFLYRSNFGNPDFALYSDSQLSNVEKKVGLSMKRGSTTAYQALLPVNIRKRWAYWNFSYPMGITDCSRLRMIDLDECGIFVEMANRTRGREYVGIRVKEPGPYSKTEKGSLLLAICGEDGSANQSSKRWSMLWAEGGTTVERMIEFIQFILNDIGHATPGNIFCFTMDNLNSHHHPAVLALILQYGRRLSFRALYYAVDGVIEYVFNSLQSLIRQQLYLVTDGPTMIAAINNLIAGMDDFSSYFENIEFLIS